MPLKRVDMNKLFFIISLMICSQVFAGEFLTQEQKIASLDAIDSICGDTWCEGDFNYEFQSINCESDNSTCVVGFKTWDYVDESINTRYSCEIQGISSFNDILKEGGHDLTEKFYDQLNACINEGDIWG
jgi:hypothetical protein